MVFPYFLCFIFSVFLCLELYYFLHAARTDMLLLLLCCSCESISNSSLSHTQFSKQICAVESNVLLNEMFTLFCDQSSNSASRQTIYLRLPLFPIPSVQVSFVILPTFMRFTCAYKTQTHLTGIITRHKHMHHAFRCTCLLFPLFFYLCHAPSSFRSFSPDLVLVLDLYKWERVSGMQLHTIGSEPELEK